MILVLIWGAYRSVKHALFYTKMDATVQTSGTGCSVRGLTDSTRAIIAKLPRLADEQWLDCNEARGTIALFPKQEVKVSTRPQAYVRFVSPADGQERVSLIALTMDQSRTMPASGATLPIYAHKKQPAVVDPDY